MADEVEMIPVAGSEPPVADLLGKPAVEKPKTLKLEPVARPAVPGASTVNGLRPGLKLPPKPGATGAFRPGLKLPTKVAKPLIRKPGSAPVAQPLPKPVEELKAVTQKLKESTQQLKGVTQQVPQQAILRKTGIVADSAADAGQQEAAKHKTVRIALSEAMGVAPVKDEVAPMKTIRIKRPVNLPGTGTASLKPLPKPVAGTPAPVADAPVADIPEPAAEATKATTQPVNITQKRTLKLPRPGGMARPAAKFGAAKRPLAIAKPAVKSAAADEVADIPDLPSTPVAPVPTKAPAKASGPAWIVSSIVQFAACVAMGVLLWFFYENSQMPTFCGGLGWAS